mmetsp:Transcript_19552/g.49366  ORF Transcript_19552/g.49366 Transcript_19552/m.49366 type:complete len:576 (+) Transcript_19552:90-1817(+)
MASNLARRRSLQMQWAAEKLGSGSGPDVTHVAALLGHLRQLGGGFLRREAAVLHQDVHQALVHVLGHVRPVAADHHVAPLVQDGRTQLGADPLHTVLHIHLVRALATECRHQVRQVPGGGEALQFIAVQEVLLAVPAAEEQPRRPQRRARSCLGGALLQKAAKGRHTGARANHDEGRAQVTGRAEALVGPQEHSELGARGARAHPLDVVGGHPSVVAVALRAVLDDREGHVRGVRVLQRGGGQRVQAGGQRGERLQQVRHRRLARRKLLQQVHQGGLAGNHLSPVSLLATPRGKVQEAVLFRSVAAVLCQHAQQGLLGHPGDVTASGKRVAEGARPAQVAELAGLAVRAGDREHLGAVRRQQRQQLVHQGGVIVSFDADGVAWVARHPATGEVNLQVEHLPVAALRAHVVALDHWRPKRRVRRVDALRVAVRQLLARGVAALCLLHHGGSSGVLHGVQRDSALGQRRDADQFLGRLLGRSRRRRRLLGAPSLLTARCLQHRLELLAPRIHHLLNPVHLIHIHRRVEALRAQVVEALAEGLWHGAEAGVVGVAQAQAGVLDALQHPGRVGLPLEGD